MAEMIAREERQAAGSNAIDAVPVYPGLGARRWALALLMLTMMLSFLDRQIVNILAEPIKRDLGLADWHIGVLTGLSFAIAYTGLAIPVAWLAARMNRPLIISTAVALWSVCTFASGFARSFGQLAIARAGVGAGEAGGVPPAHSLISDMTPREERASALAIFHLGIPLGTLAGLALGGVLVDRIGWRGAFMMAGLPGLLVALLVLLTLRETRPSGVAVPEHSVGQPTIGETLRHLRTKKSFWMMSLGGALKSFIGYAHIPFTAAFFFRVHGDELGRIAQDFGLQAAGLLGIALGLITGIGGGVGIWLGGRMADRLGRKDLRAYATIPALATLVALPFMLSAYLVASPIVALALLFLPAVFNMFYMAPMHFTGQSVVPPQMRAHASALVLIIVNVIGMGLGPLFVGLLSDGLAQGLALGPAEGVRWSLIVSALLGLPTFAFFWTARRRIADDLMS